MVLASSPKKEKLIFMHDDVQKKAYAWHAHDSREVLALIGSKAEGLQTEEIEERRTKFGDNNFTERPAPGIFSRLLSQLKSPMTFVLVVAFFLTVGLREYVDAIVISIALLVAIGIGALQEGKASQAFRKLSHSTVKMATVFRSGSKHLIPAHELVLGDVVELQSGEHVPADVRLIHTKKLSVNEAPLTGEWMAVVKHSEAVAVGTPFAEQSNMAWLGTFVSEGSGLGVVIATGDFTVMGNIANDLQVIEDSDTPLQVEMAKVSRVMLYIIAVLVLIIFVVGLFTGQGLNEMLLMSVAIAVASIPEGLPAAVTIILAVGMEALLKRGGLVRNLLAAETLGSTTYVLTDKTGTLTEAKMSLTGVIHHDVTNLQPDSWVKNSLVKSVLDTSLCAANAYLDTENGKDILRGDPVEKAILEASLRAEIDQDESALSNNRVDYLAFTSENRFAAGLAKHEKGYRLCINGAPERLLDKAKSVHTGEKNIKMTEATREHFDKLMNEYTKDGKRLVAVAHKDVSYDEIDDDGEAIDKLIDDCVFVGVVILNDPVRKGVKDAIAGVKDAGAEVILVTGDNPVTALSIAKQVGIAAPSESALTGDDLMELSDEEILNLLETVHVFARVMPKQKLRLAQILQARGEIVAMTGDGINDALALKKANIGIAIGSGTEVAIESSDLVLIDNSFETIYAAIEEGRRIVSNLRKIVAYLISTSLSEVVLIGTALVLGSAIPILPAQILWANLIEEGLMSVAFAFEPGDKKAMRRKPQDIQEEGILSREMLWFMAFVVTVLSLIMVTLYLYLRSINMPIDELRSMMFLVVSMDSLFMAFAFRSLTTPLWKMPFHTNMFFVGSFIVSALLLLAALSVPILQKLVSYQPLPLNDLALVFAFSLASLLTVECGKWLFFEGKE